MFNQFTGIGSDVSEMYISGMSLGQIAKATATHPSTLRYRLIKLGVKLRTNTEGIALAAVEERMGMKKGYKRKWKSIEEKNGIVGRFKEWATKNSKGTRITPSGYVEYTTGPNKGRSEHVVNMEAHIGRKLINGEVVHHKDENKQNNNIDNLELMTKSTHMALHKNKAKEN